MQGAVFSHVNGPQQTSTIVAGVASDALKVAEYRSALRLRGQMLQAGAWSSGGDEAAYKNFSRILSKACGLSPITIADSVLASALSSISPIMSLLPVTHQMSTCTCGVCADLMVQSCCDGWCH